MRPNIPSELESKIEQCYSKYGFSNKSELVRYATRQFLLENDELGED